jgi:glyoxylase-like metal-dependent hydrolase (beta-lactamase superfamily II)
MNVDLVETCSSTPRRGTRVGASVGSSRAGPTVSVHALTHAHPDHLGSSDEVCGRLDIPYWGDSDVSVAERPALIGESQPPHATAC